MYPFSFWPDSFTASLSPRGTEVIDRFVFLLFFGPTHSPRPLPPRRAEEGANTIFGRVNKQKKYTHQSTLKNETFQLI